VDRSFERDPLVGAGMECDWSLLLLLLGVMMRIVVLLGRFENGGFFFWMDGLEWWVAGGCDVGCVMGEKVWRGLRFGGGLSREWKACELEFKFGYEDHLRMPWLFGTDNSAYDASGVGRSSTSSAMRVCLTSNPTRMRM
jgi:hypothetical protein